jgi:ferrous iron transport protein B
MPVPVSSGQTIATHSVTVAICGNPNCGKTTIFNGITGLNQKVGNYPGVTVEKVSGQFRVDSHPKGRFTLVDVPGSYSLAAFSPDEYIAARALFGDIKGEAPPDVVVCVIDATNLERGLYFLFQVAQIGRPLVVALNMIDLAERRGLHFDSKRLSQELGGIPVVPVIGSRGKGIRELKQAVAEMAVSPVAPRTDWYHPMVENVAAVLRRETGDGCRSNAECYRVIFDLSGPAERDFLRTSGESGRRQLKQARESILQEFGSLSAGEIAPLTARSEMVYQRVVSKSKSRKNSRSEKIDRLLLHPILGPLILVSIMTLIFQSIFSWAEPLMDGIDSVFGALAAQVQGSLPEGPLRSLLADGVIGGVGSVLVFLPQIIILFIYIAILEDSGYMPRAAFLVDRLFGWCGLSGKSFIPMLSSFACAIPGIMATRTIEDRKLRTITILVSPLMSCSARLPVYTIMIAAFIPHVTYWGIFNSQGLVLTCLYLLGVMVAVIVSFILSRTVFRTERGTFMMEMPSYKMPTLKSIYIRVYGRARSFVIRAGTVIFAITIIIWALSYYPRSEEIQSRYESEVAALQSEYSATLNTYRGQIEAASSPDGGATTGEIKRLAAQLGDFKEPERLIESGRSLAAKSGVADSLVDLLINRRRTEIEYDVLSARLANEAAGANLRNSYFGRAGRAIEPVFHPLGWDWRITMAALSSFPAREVIIATLGTIFNLGEAEEQQASLVTKMRGAVWEHGPRIGEPLFTPAVALSIMVFFALCCQCGATLVTIRQETAHWIYAAGTFVYMTALAYVSALVTYQLFSHLGT